MAQEDYPVNFSLGRYSGKSVDCFRWEDYWRTHQDMWSALRWLGASRHVRRWTRPNCKSMLFPTWYSLTIICQVSQRLSEWRGSFGSAAIAIVNAFFDDNDNYRDSNDMRQEFATHMLEKLRFVYRQAKGNDAKVIHFLCTIQHANYDIYRNSAASFAAPLSSRLSLLTTMPFRAQDGSTGSMKENRHRSLVQHLLLQRLRCVITHIMPGVYW